MTFEDMFNTIRSRFDTQIATPQNLPTQYDNVKFNNPDSSEWCRLTILPGESRQVDIGGPNGSRYRTVGIMAAQLFSPVGNGDQKLLEFADLIKNAFRSVTVSGVTFRTPSIYRIGRVENEWQINVNCPFYADDVG